MKWISVSAVPETWRSNAAVFCVNEDGELWVFLPIKGRWRKMHAPPESDDLQKQKN